MFVLLIGVGYALLMVLIVAINSWENRSWMNLDGSGECLPGSPKQSGRL